MIDNPSYFWHDYETFGIDPQRDRPSQFAGIRTDADFNIIDEPLVVYCKPPADYLPNPDACVITGITPQIAEQRGVCEAEFIRQIHEQMARTNTCVLGYNNVRFDDEVTRNTLYRNFYDPYEREWRNGNSRWDLIDVVRATRALRPEGIVWPFNEAENRPSFRLEELTKANHIEHNMAHDALSDVYATIAIAKLIKEKQPKLYQFLWANRCKAAALNLLQFGNFKPIVHISGKYPARKDCLAVVLPVCQHPTNSNGIIVCDLSIDPEAMLSLSVDDIQYRLFTATANLPEGVDRIPLKTVHINKCPVLAPINVIKPEDAQRLNIDLTLCQKHIDKIKLATGLTDKLLSVFSNESFNLEHDVDLAIYSGGFFSESDRLEMAKIKRTPPEQLVNTHFNFADNRLSTLLFRYRARNYPNTLTVEERQVWQQFCADRLTGLSSGGGIIVKDYLARLQELAIDNNVNQDIIKILANYLAEKMSTLQISTVM